MLALAKRGAELHTMVRDGRWGKRLTAVPFDLYDKTVLIVGFGRIGTRSAKRCQAMEMNVLVYDPYVPAAAVAAAGCEPVADLDAALRAPTSQLLPHNARLLACSTRRYFARLSPRIPRQHRGRLIDEPRCKRPLRRESSPARLDVFQQEPTPTDNPLLALPNVISAPHMAGVTRESLDRMGLQTARNILSALDGAPIRDNVINKEVLG